MFINFGKSCSPTESLDVFIFSAFDFFPTPRMVSVGNLPDFIVSEFTVDAVSQTSIFRASIKNTSPRLSRKPLFCLSRAMNQRQARIPVL
jgi:hypothetical protein